MPAVSVILAVYNGYPYLNKAILSVLNQNFFDFELIIVDDGSTDNSLETIRNISNTDKRIKFFHKTHSGLAASLNLGLSLARGEFIARIDADDIWLPNKLKYQYEYLKKHQEIKLLGSSVKFIDNADCLLKAKGFNRGEFMNAREVLSKIARNNLFCHSSVIFKAEVFKTVEKYNESFVSSMDYDLWVRILEKFPAVILKEELVFYRISSNMQSVLLRNLQIKESRFIRKNALKLLGMKPIRVYYYFIGQIELTVSLILFNIKILQKKVLFKMDLL